MSKKFAVTIVLLLVAVLFVSVGTAFAQDNGPLLGPCNDFNEDGKASGFEYAQYHIRTFAHAGILGQGHKPGTHNGFSICDPSTLN